jgi:uncharacterized repeat protein (TIGR03803 family)
VKRLLVLFASCAAVIQCAVMPTALGQENASTNSPDLSAALVRAHSGLSQAETEAPSSNARKVDFGGNWIDPRPSRVDSKGPTGGFSVDLTFMGSNGGRPTGSLIQDIAGNIYGTTSSGGSGLGVVFKVDTANHETVLHVFNGPDGAGPHGSLVLDGSGNLYGTTSSGGAYDKGTVFKVAANGTETVLHSFTGNPDGARPYAGLAMDASGNLYGTTEQGGVSGCGTIFRIKTGGTEIVLYSFTGGFTDGADPKARLILDSAGNLYGTTFEGGSSDNGTVFKLDTTNTETVLYSFTGGSDGGNPFGGVTMGGDGTLYGTAELGGINALNPHYGCCKIGDGVVFSLIGSSETVLYAFTGGNDGGSPASDLVLYDGVLYGTTLFGGPGHSGTVFSVTIASGSERVLHGFTGKADGATPGAGLFLNATGVFYGTTEKGGGFKQGIVFQLKK